MEPIRMGVIGCGVIGATHVTSAAKSPLLELVAVADMVEERARAAAEKFNVPSYYDNEEDLLNDERVEAVALAIPAGVRTPIAFEALKKGKHVVLEKPAASHAEEIVKMISLRGDRVVACCSSRKALSSHAEAAAKCVASGSLGKIRVVRIRAMLSAAPSPADSPPPWRQSMKLNGGGILVNWSFYDLDYLMHITGWQLRPKDVLAKWWPVAEKMSDYVAAGSDADSHYIAFVLCEDDIVLSMERSEFTSATTEQAWEVIGTEGTLHLPMQPKAGDSNAVILDRFLPGQGVVSEAIWEEGEERRDRGGSDDVLEDFAQAVREDRPPKTTLEQALVMQKIIDAIYASAESGRSISIS